MRLGWTLPLLGLLITPRVGWSHTDPAVCANFTRFVDGVYGDQLMLDITPNAPPTRTANGVTGLSLATTAGEQCVTYAMNQVVARLDVYVTNVEPSERIRFLINGSAEPVTAVFANGPDRPPLPPVPLTISGGELVGSGTDSSGYLELSRVGMTAFTICASSGGATAGVVVQPIVNSFCQCGNGSKHFNEPCDDGDTQDGDGCSHHCVVEPGWQCTSVLFQTSVCSNECGDGNLDPGETCDDAALQSGDGCSATCQREPGYTCAGQPSVCSLDGDGDSVADAVDNCPTAANMDQRDDDTDGPGNACDNCPTVANSDQVDTGGAPLGDACEDRDGDGVVDAADNCPIARNTDQRNTGGGPAGDACDDRDRDGVVDTVDTCVDVADPAQADRDGDRIGDACDPCDGPPDDRDGDGLETGCDNCPAVSNPGQENTGGTAAGDHCDDRDSDTVVDALDNCPSVSNPDQADVGGSAAGDACDDRDADGVLDLIDNCPDDANPDQAAATGAERGVACAEPAAGCCSGGSGAGSSLFGICLALLSLRRRQRA